VARTYRELLTEARKAVPEITSEDLKKKIDAREEFLLIDVRDPDEWRADVKRARARLKVQARLSGGVDRRA